MMRKRSLDLEYLETRNLPSTTYFIAPTGSDLTGDGSSAHPFATIQRGADIAQPGDTVDVRAGQYAGFVLGWDFPQGGTPAAPITYKAEPGVLIVTRNDRTPDGIDLEPGDSYVNIIGFNVNNADGSMTRAGIRVTGSDHVNVVGNTCTGIDTWGIFTAFSNDTLIQNNITINAQTQHGIYVSNSAQRPRVVDNTIFGNAQCGIQFNGDISQGGTGIVTDALVAGNVIHDNGTQGGAAINGDGLCNSVIEDNLLYANHASGIALFQQDGATGSTNNLIVNNTIVMAADARWAININTASTGNVLFNNVIFNENPNNGDILIDDVSLPGFRSDHNVLGGQEDVGDGSSFVDLPTWTAQTGQDARSIVSTEAAVFAAPLAQNYQLAPASPALNAGLNAFDGYIPSTSDLLGKPRPAGGAFDIGAYESQTGLPAFTLSGGSTLNAGATYTLTLATSAPTNNGPVSWVVNWGDGILDTVNVAGPTLQAGRWQTTVTATHVYSSPAHPTLAASATDRNGTYRGGNTIALTVAAPASPAARAVNRVASSSAAADTFVVLPGPDLTTSPTDVPITPGRTTRRTAQDIVPWQS